jgi:hypothetical protein
LLVPFTHGFVTSTSTARAKCCDIRELWSSVCFPSHSRPHWHNFLSNCAKHERSRLLYLCFQDSVEFDLKIT